MIQEKLKTAIYVFVTTITVAIIIDLIIIIVNNDFDSGLGLTNEQTQILRLLEGGILVFVVKYFHEKYKIRKLLVTKREIIKKLSYSHLIGSEEIRNIYLMVQHARTVIGTKDEVNITEERAVIDCVDALKELETSLLSATKFSDIDAISNNIFENKKKLEPALGVLHEKSGTPYVFTLKNSS